MSEYKNAVPDGASIENGGENRISRRAINLPVDQYTTGTAHAQAIADILPRGAKNAISTPALVALTGCGDPRALQRRIAAEREAGVIILSSANGGYFLPAAGDEGRREIQRYIDTLRARALNTLKAIKSARAALRVLDGQGELNDG